MLAAAERSDADDPVSFCLHEGSQVMPSYQLAQVFVRVLRGKRMTDSHLELGLCVRGVSAPY